MDPAEEGGDPGIGKSTLLTQLALNVDNTLYIAGEESAQQIKLRVDRIKSNVSLSVLNEVDVDLIIEAVTQTKPSLVIVDSIQTLETSVRSIKTPAVEHASISRKSISSYWPIVKTAQAGASTRM